MGSTGFDYNAVFIQFSERDNSKLRWIFLNGNSIKNSIKSNMQVVHNILNGGTEVKSKDVILGELLVAA